MSSSTFVFSISYLLLLPFTTSLTFNIPSFEPNTPHITYTGNASVSKRGIQLTTNQAGASLTSSVGRAFYNRPVRLWDNTGNITDFTTHFSFVINKTGKTFGDGLAFFIAAEPSTIPNNSAGGYLGLYEPPFNITYHNSSTVAVEFDTYQNIWDPSSNHVGIDVNSIVSVTSVTRETSMMTNGSTAYAWITYNSTIQNLSVFLTYDDNATFDGDPSLSLHIDLKTYLPEEVFVGFSAATGSVSDIHKILSWNFRSTLEDANTPGTKLFAPIAAALAVSIAGISLIWFVLWKKKSIKRNDDLNLAMEDDFEKATGPKRFSYKELSRATDNFSEERKLGEGGFGGVYRGLLITNPGTEVAVKRVSKSSKQGKKEYVSEVTIISRLRHRNLVQLIGWCHEQGELLLVYEYMPNGSLDTHLFGKKTGSLPWPTRHKIALGLASALRYLHEEWEQCVVHRDIKSSNVMLDSSFNAKLGDFGLARLVDHDLGSQTTVVAGTMGYLAPDCVISGKASKESDVYSFGVVALEIACGRRPIDHTEEPGKVRMVEWVWNLYGKELLTEAIDQTLGGRYDEEQIIRLMIVGLWCCHPDHSLRPSIKQAIDVLNLEAQIPRLPVKFPVAVYMSQPMDMSSLFSYTSSTQTASSGGYNTGSSSGVSTAIPLLRTPVG